MCMCCRVYMRGRCHHSHPLATCQIVRYACNLPKSPYLSNSNTILTNQEFKSLHSLSLEAHGQHPLSFLPIFEIYKHFFKIQVHSKLVSSTFEDPKVIWRCFKQEPSSISSYFVKNPSKIHQKS
ncbi:hypothetical protein HanIR_Chr08g0382931 [Helianthus annuus]|nr:hypothetical protein HanIR_Chr08g0382931 [Helianthus annuus]